MAGDADRTVVDHPAERHNSDVGRPAANVHHHVAARLIDGQPRTNRRSHGLFYKINFARFCAVRGVLHGTLFHGGNFARYFWSAWYLK